MFRCTKVRPHRTDAIHKEAEACRHVGNTEPPEELVIEELQGEEEEELLGCEDDACPQLPGVELPVCEMLAARSLAPLVHPTSTPSVVGGLVASSSSSLGNPYLNLFYMRQAKFGTRMCGLYMPWKLWKFDDWTI